MRDLIFLSYSRQDPAIYAEVRQRLLDQGLGDRLWDDTEIRLGERWDPKLQEGMDWAAVAVLILSDGYFRRRQGGGEYILEIELPYFLERWQAGELDLLPIYWRPSPHFAPDRRDPIKPFPWARRPSRGPSWMRCAGLRTSASRVPPPNRPGPSKRKPRPSANRPRSGRSASPT